MAWFNNFLVRIVNEIEKSRFYENNFKIKFDSTVCDILYYNVISIMINYDVTYDQPIGLVVSIQASIA